MKVFDFARIRIKEEELDNANLSLLCNTICDRLTLRLGESKLPDAFERIAADATVKAFRRMYYEGISSETVSDISTSFISDILDEYNEEIEAYKTYGKYAAEDVKTDIVRFL